MNETERPGGAAPAGEIPVPILPEEAQTAPEQTENAPAIPEEKRFSASRPEFWGALACFALGWIWFDQGKALWLLLFVAGFIGLTELLHRETPRPRESWVWLGCVLVLTAALALDRCNAWRNKITNGHFEVACFLHIFAVWWVLSRGGRLAEGKSRHLLPYDAFNGFILFPFKHFFLQARCLWYGLTHIGRGEKRLRAGTLLWSAGAALAALLLFIQAIRLLMQADAGFDKLLGSLAYWFSFDFEWFRLFLALHVAAYIFGLVAGSAREDAARVRAVGERLNGWLPRLRRVPGAVFTVTLALFGLLYLGFFVLQGSYLFGAFTRTLPEGFVVAEYARQGFFELCRVMALNFALLWLAARFAGTPLRENRPLRALAVVLLVESLVFAVIAASKLGLYIDCFGFTPKRLQAAWLVTVLSAGCGCALYSLCTGKKSFRAWMIFGAVTLSLLCLY